MQNDKATRLTRRHFLMLSTALGAGTVFGCGSAAENAPLAPRITPPSGPNATLEVRMAENIVDGSTFFHRSYNGLIGGPVLRAKPGETYRLRLINSLPPNTDVAHPADINIPHEFNTTNLHSHGFHVSPNGESDNVFLSIKPGETFEYFYEIPEDHPAGTFFYHPHKHGAVAMQMFSGMGGMIIIEGDIDRVPEIAAAKEVPFVINELQKNAEGRVPEYTEKGAFKSTFRTFTVNGESKPVFRIRPGEVQRFRVLNAGVAWTIPFEVEGHSQHVIAFDGITYPRTVEGNVEILSPANRFDFLLRGGAPGTYKIFKQPYQQANPAFGRIAETPQVHLADLVVEGDPVTDMGIPTTLPNPVSLPDILPSEITGRRTVVYASQFNSGGPSPEFPDNFTVDGQRFLPNRVDQLVELGAVEEWTLTNPVDDTEHPFHIHVNPFQVVAINGTPVTPRWQDTVILPRMGEVTIRTRFEDFTGLFVNHCHILAHEDLGMMQNVMVVDPRES